ncbi:DUF4105 domain-containing protein [Mariniflexile sp. AS56]|uniref:lipoprotein N-acyltransferase Lnb domain-containing protein n=1 Tax=Mariniflexile sp. AS56 TaxID=3063957 RepID=UPI0026EF89F7|nr:DUF4105 domain-containing protein [Mariniflexile sp. AS56]MDO7172702.1 DUF4105 domain-containing protein [Mariniflexile sp. AS56]
MQKKLLFLCLFLFVEIIQGQQNILSEQAEISVLTIGAGTSLNDAFGHSAFRVKDPVKGADLVFNYGVYDFETPNFYLKFAQGKLNYLIGFNYYEDFFEAYISQNRTIQEQVLNLSSVEKQKLFDYLLNNIKPENRGYLYDFFYDNCATKIKDVTNIPLNNAIVFKEPKDFKEQTFRTLIQNNLNNNSWGSFGIDIALGSVIDRKAKTEDHMFLPENIYKFFEVATIKGNNESLVKKSNVLYKKMEIPTPTQFLGSPIFVFGIFGLFILYITYNDFKKQKQTIWLDVTLFSITGLIGVLILLLWFATDHKGTHQNYNLLWAFALNILVIGQLFKQKPSRWFVKYLKLLVILLCLLTLHWFMGVQVFAIGLIPLLIALFVRYIYLIKIHSQRL